MASYSEVAQGLLLFAKVEGDKTHVCAEHDVISAGPSRKLLSQAEVRSLEKWGWHYDEFDECWCCFV